MAMWYSLIISLRDCLKADVTLSGVNIAVGAVNPNDINTSNGAIFIMRDSESQEQIRGVGNTGKKGDCSLLIECWTRSDDVDPAVGYKKLSDLEDALTAALFNWVIAIGKTFAAGTIQNVVIGETRGDQDSMRPDLGSQKQIKISWSK